MYMHACMSLWLTWPFACLCPGRQGQETTGSGSGWDRGGQGGGGWTGETDDVEKKTDGRRRRHHHHLPQCISLSFQWRHFLLRSLTGRQGSMTYQTGVCGEEEEGEKGMGRPSTYHHPSLLPLPPFSVPLSLSLPSPSLLSHP